MIVPDETHLTPREAEMMRYEKEERDAARAHAETMKKLEIKWQQLFSIPLALIYLPIRLVLVVPVCIAYLRKHEPSESFWRLLR